MKKYFKDLNIVRLIACILVLLYHLNILKGGYLAVCTFFVLSGYLSTISAMKKEKFSLKEYYINRFKHLYLPLILVVFIAIFVISLIPSISWLNLKPETTSVLLGYNNFWQLNANLDYFARHVSSPFMHLWYISILLQFDLIFPFLFMVMKKIGEKAKKFLPCLFTFIFAVLSIVFFAKSLENNIMIAYYNTFARMFALLLGMTLGFMQNYYGLKIIKNKIFSKLAFIFYLAILIVLNILIPADSPYLTIAMIGVTLISMRLIAYASINDNELNIFDRVIKFLSDMSYEIYLVQYPVIFVFQELEFESDLKVFLIIIITLVISYILHLALDFKSKKCKALKIALLILLIGCSAYGCYQYIIAVDHTAEMKALEEQLSQNSKLMAEQQEAYKAKAAEEQEKWKQMMADLDSNEENLKKIVADVPSAFIGDSVMLGAKLNIEKTFKNAYFNAEISRTCYVVNDILKDLIRKNALGDVIVLNFGANGDCSQATKETILKTIGDRKVFWLTVTNDKKVHFNDKIKAFAAKYDNLYIIDWEAISKGHKEYFYSDGLHLPTPGRIAYTNAIYEAIYKVYLDEFNAKKEEIMNKHNEDLKTQISFYGNDIILNAFDSLKNEFKNGNFVLNKDFTYEEVKSELEKNKDNLTHRLVFAFDQSLKLTKEEYQSIVDLCKDHEIYIVNMSSEKLDLENVEEIDFYSEIKTHRNYVMADKIHLTTEGNKAFVSKLTEVLNSFKTEEKQD